MAFSICTYGAYSILSTSASAEVVVVSGEAVPATVLTMEVMQPSFNPNPSLPRGGGDIVIEDGVLLVAESGVEGTIVEVERRDKAGAISVYEVREGDSLSAIAAMFDVSVNTIRWANDIKGSITPGQKLVILPVSGLRYKVKKGDTLASIAKDHDADLSEIALFNGLAEDTALAIGEEVVVPNAESNPAFAVAKPKTAAKSGSKAVKTNKVGTTPAASGYYGNPAPGSVITQGLHGYNGVDFGAPTGTSVVAAAPGTVILSKGDGGWNGGYGNYVIISHGNGTQTLYSHMSSVSVSVGDELSRGDYIGAIGSTGKSTGPHLHFEVRGATNPFGY